MKHMLGHFWTRYYELGTVVLDQTRATPTPHLLGIPSECTAFGVPGHS